MNIRKPTRSELEAIETELRLIYAKQGFVPKGVRLAGDNVIALRTAWLNESARYYYLAVRKGIAPQPGSLIELIQNGDGIDYEELSDRDLWAVKKGRDPDAEPF